jgi:mono/diheme cytochrome c family protein
VIRRLARLLLIVLATIGVAAAVTAVWLVCQGISARSEPGRLETAVARRLRAAAIPRAARSLKSPVPASPGSSSEGLEHFADHCAVCHANDGSGDTKLGRGLYPRPPDLRRPATQSLTDGELFYIVENGVRLTGMPAWGDGTPASEQASWHLVQFLRRLPTITPEEIARMQELNPKTALEFRDEEEARKFLAGESAAPKPAPAHKHGGRE